MLFIGHRGTRCAPLMINSLIVFYILLPFALRAHTSGSVGSCVAGAASAALDHASSATTSISALNRSILLTMCKLAARHGIEWLHCCEVSHLTEVT